MSGDRKVDPKTGKAPPVGNTVDVKSASYTNAIGAAELSAVWTDPDFDPKERAFYYVRVLEIPTPRWSTYDDPIVRRRIAQKLVFIAEGTTPEAPTERELQAFLDAHPGDYRGEARFSLEQVLFDPLRHRGTLDVGLAEARKRLEAARGTANDASPPVVGDPSTLPAKLQSVTGSELESQFGKLFAEAVRKLPVGTWQGPITSAYGVHLVRLNAREEERVLTLAAARADVERDLLRVRTEQANAAMYRKLRQQYAVRIEAPSATPTSVVAGQP